MHRQGSKVCRHLPKTASTRIRLPLHFDAADAGMKGRRFADATALRRQVAGLLTTLTLLASVLGKSR